MSQPLSDLKVLDFSTLLPGPLATLWMADLGACVIKVESFEKPDPMRLIPPFFGGNSVLHAFLNRSKKSLALDLKQAVNVDKIKSLIKTQDVLVESFRPGVMARLGLDYETLKKINPKLIYCSISGYGQTGPWANKAGHDANFLALSGILSYTGTKTNGPPPLGVQPADVAGGAYPALVSILAALVQRAKTGEGQWLDVSMLEGSLWLQALTIPSYLALGVVPNYESLAFNGGGFYGFYQTKDNRYLSIACLEAHFWKRFCEIIGKPEWEKRTIGWGADQSQTLQQDIAEIILTKPLEAWQAIFDAENVCVEPVLTLSEAFDHPQLTSREIFLTLKDELHHQQQLAFPVKMAGSKNYKPFPAAKLGEHNDEILEGG